LLSGIDAVNDVISDGEATDWRRRLGNVENVSKENAESISTHEAVCAERYQAILGQFKAVNNRQNLLLAVAGIIVMGDLFGWPKALLAAIKLLGVSP
jgi:hypothetical protein